jgi:hypothetical protein
MVLRTRLVVMASLIAEACASTPERGIVH